MVRCLFVLAVLCNGAVAVAQGGNSVKVAFKPDIKRALFHDNVDKSQRAALRADGKADARFTLSTDDEINYLVTESLVQEVDSVQYKIERDSLIDHRHKVFYLTGLDKMLKAFASNVRTRSFAASNWPLTLETFVTAVNLDKTSATIEPLVISQPYDVGNMLIGSGALDRKSVV